MYPIVNIETHCGPAKIYFGWPDWPARVKVNHDPCIYICRLTLVSVTTFWHLRYLNSISIFIFN